MSINHVNDLRRRGHWQAALDAALDNLHFMDTEWTQMSLFWVIYDMCKMDLVTDRGGGKMFCVHEVSVAHND